ncbi:type II toxin-antitoxin system RelE/ParE family toxin [Actinobacillus genomosp. 1]|nr:type II toxin-antitoxin system RelE/ParE family toxin [Actinobacillus genomosp. 1]WGE33757.1 type II toxin-antitoxin system RelE/ParE family toxin [Actinobacillus genomosp. 1]WGE35795.1 type II toxin-antitoxin system RelE/ParE family toxin [Actinobacillus genomosp. 1]WGE91120.1 type II toxin-antitoxin system RelE/ParE family toxin [Actinobacillus genomosp. 1]
MYKFSVKAKQDLTAITHYTTEQFGHKQSDEYLHHLKKTLENITSFPQMGISRSEIGLNIFSFVCQSHTIYYQIKSNYILVVRILNNRMDHKHYM